MSDLIINEETLYEYMKKVVGSCKMNKKSN